MNKEFFLTELEKSLSNKNQVLQNEIEQLRLDISSDSKSTAGDKHETSRAMAQLEMEKLGNQLLDYQKQIQWLRQFENVSSDFVRIGSLVQLSNAWYFVGLGIGKFQFENQSVFCLSVQSPLGAQLMQKKVGDEITLPTMKLQLEKII